MPFVNLPFAINDQNNSLRLYSLGAQVHMYMLLLYFCSFSSSSLHGGPQTHWSGKMIKKALLAWPSNAALSANMWIKLKADVKLN